MAVRARKRRRSDWRPMVALAAVAVVGWLVLLAEQPIVAWLALTVAIAALAWAGWRRIDQGRDRRRRSPQKRPGVGPSAARRPAGDSSAGAAGAPGAGGHQLSGAQFEQLVAGLLERDGFDVQVSGGSGDRGADLKAISPEHNLVVVQCKCYRSKPVDDPMMQTFLGTARQVHNAAIPLYVTTSRFTTPAKQLAREHGIVLVDGLTLADWTRGDWRLPDEPTEFVGEIRTT